MVRKEKGNGPDSDHAADLTDDLRTELNTEGVLFYKVRNSLQLRRDEEFVLPTTRRLRSQQLSERFSPSIGTRTCVSICAASDSVTPSLSCPKTTQTGHVGVHS